MASVLSASLLLTFVNGAESEDQPPKVGVEDAQPGIEGAEGSSPVVEEGPSLAS